MLPTEDTPPRFSQVGNVPMLVGVVNEKYFTEMLLPDDRLQSRYHCSFPPIQLDP